jgi:hypothetical protein
MQMSHEHEKGSHALLTSVSQDRLTVTPVQPRNFREGIRNLRSIQLKKKLAGLLVVAIFAALLVPAFAGAETTSPSSDQYSGHLSQVTPGGDDGPPPPGPPPHNTPPPSSTTGLGGNVGPLPFTGFDVIAMAAVALAVTGLGLALQRAVSRDTGDELG